MGKAEIEAAIKTLEGWSRTVDNWVLICAAGVAIFLAAEVVFSVIHWRTENKLRPLRVTQSQLHEDELVKLNNDTVRLSAEAEAAKSEIATANAEAAKANERSAELKLALEKEIAARQPRHVNQQKLPQLIANLAKITNKGAITVTWKLFDEEAERFGKEILSALKEGGFDAKEARGPLGFGIAGQWVMVRDLRKYQAHPSWVGEVQAVLNDALGLNFDGQEMDPVMAAKSELYGDISIAVGAKP